MAFATTAESSHPARLASRCRTASSPAVAPGPGPVDRDRIIWIRCPAAALPRSTWAASAPGDTPPVYWRTHRSTDSSASSGIGRRPPMT